MSRRNRKPQPAETVVQNAASVKQVKEAKEREQSRREQELSDLAVLLELPEGKRFFWRLLTHCKTFESIWHSSALIHYNAGTQDIGHWMLSEIAKARPDVLPQMMLDAYAQETTNA